MYLLQNHHFWVGRVPNEEAQRERLVAPLPFTGLERGSNFFFFCSSFSLKFWQEIFFVEHTHEDRIFNIFLRSISGPCLCVCRSSKGQREGFI